MAKVTEADVLKFWEVREWLKTLKTFESQDDLINTRMILVDLKDVVNDLVGTLDRNVDAFKVNAANGMYGKNFKVEVSRIHQPRGRKASAEAAPVDEKAALLSGLKLS